MEQLMVLDAKEKRKIGAICIVPSFLFLISLVYYIIILFPLTRGYHPPAEVVSVTSDHYSTLFIMLAISAMVSAAVLIYCIVHLVRIKMLNTPTKMLWLLVLVTFVPASFVVFWLFQIRKEPRYQAVYNDIA